MVKRNSEEKEFNEAIILGRKNQKLLPKVKGWCRHIDVRMISAGILARAYNLPIGRMEIICEHASSSSFQAMQLDRIATSFILQNCKDCPFHETLDIDNIGLLILNEAENVLIDEAETNIDLGSDKYDSLKQSLSDKVSGDIVQALSKAEDTSQSILKLVILLDDEIHHNDAAKK